MGIFESILPAIAAPFVQGMFGYAGQQETNEKNIEIARENNAFNAAEAEKARTFNAGQADIARMFNAQEAAYSRHFQSNEATEARGFNAHQAAIQRHWATEMAGSSYQRAVKDLQAAGLNPMLAYQQGGAATPSGASASGPAASGAMASSGAASGPSANAAANPVIGNKNQAAITSAAAAAQLAQQLAAVKQTEAQTRNIEVLTESERMKQPGHMLSGELAQTQVRKLKEEVLKVIEDTQVSAQTKSHINTLINNAIKQGYNIDETLNLLREQVKSEQGQQVYRALQSELIRLDIKGEAGARSRYFDGMGPTTYGLRDAASLLNSAGAAKALFRQK